MPVASLMTRRLAGGAPQTGPVQWPVTLPTGAVATSRAQYTNVANCWQPGALDLANYPTVVNVANATELQTALDNATRGTRIVLQNYETASVVYSTTDGFLLKPISGTGGVLICSAAISSGTFPKSGTGYNQRATISDAGKCARIVVTGNAAASCFKGVTVAAGGPGINGDLRGYRFAGLHLRDNGTNYPLSLNLELQSNKAGGETYTYNSLATEPSEIVWDRCLFENTASTLGDGASFGVALHGRRNAVVACSVINMSGLTASAEPKAIATYRGSGEHYIDNCFLEGLGINVMVGGYSVTTEDMRPDDIVVRRCHMYKRPSWLSGISQLKNLFEMKMGHRALLEACVLENHRAAGQIYSLLLYSVNQDGIGPNDAHWVRDVTVRYCDFRNVGGAFNIPRVSYTSTTATPMSRICFDHLTFLTNATGVSTNAMGAPSDSTLRNVTLYPVVEGSPTNGYQPSDDVDTGATGFVMQNVITAGWNRTSTSNGLVNTLAAGYLPGSTFARNILAREFSSSVPSNNYYAANYAAIGYTNAPTDLSLATGSLGKNAGTDGFDIGCDQSGLSTLTANCVDGQWT